jgi:hypothetical protein
MAEKKFDAQNNYGWGLTLNMTGKAPAVSKRIFNTLADAQAFANDYNDSAIEGLLLSVVADGNNNGVYFIQSIKTGADADAAVLEKLSTSSAAAGDLSGAIAALDYADTAIVDEYVSAINQTDGKISVNRAKFADAIVAKDAEGNNVKLADKFAAIDTAIANAQATAIASGTKLVKDAAASNITVTENRDASTGALTYTIGQSDIASAALLGTLNDAATANTAFGKAAAAQAEAEAASGQCLVIDNSLKESGAVGSKIKANADAIATLNGTGAGSVSKAVADAKAELLGDAAAEYNTLGKLEDKIQEVAGAAKSYEIVAVTEGLASNVKEAFKLVDEKGVQSGVQINVYKDSALKSIALEGADGSKQELVYTYTLADGTDEEVRVDVSKFLAEAEFKNGLEVSLVNGTVSVKVDEASEDFLTVSENGVKLSGVQNAIDSKVNGLNANVSSAEGGKVKVNVVEANGVITGVTVTESDIASAQELDNLEALVGTASDTATQSTAFGKAAEAKAAAAKALTDAQTYADNAVKALNVTDTAVAGKYVSAVKEVEGKIEVTRADLPVDTLISGSANGTVAFNGTDVAVTGLKSAAYTEASAYDAAGAADAAKAAVIGTSADASTENTVYGAKAYTDEALSWYEG